MGQFTMKIEIFGEICRKLLDFSNTRSQILPKPQGFGKSILQRCRKMAKKPEVRLFLTILINYSIHPCCLKYILNDIILPHEAGNWLVLGIFRNQW